MMKILSNSTRSFIKEARQADNYSLADFLHGYIYGRWTYLYIGIGKGDHPVAKRFRDWQKRFGYLGSLSAKSGSGTEPEAKHTFADGYHGKVLHLETARQLVTVNEDITLKDLEKVIPYPRARDIILKNPDHIIALECPCRSGKQDPCRPIGVCLIVGEPFASFVNEHHASKSRWISSEEAVDILEAENARGHVAHAFFKDAMLGRFYAICNCCSCCCGAINSHRNGNPMLASSGYLAEVDSFLCQACGECLESCQFEALSMNYDLEIDQTNCMGCGVCVDHCNQGALKLVRDPAKGVPLEIYNLMEQVT